MRRSPFAYPPDMKTRVLARIEAGLTSTMLQAEHGWPSRASLFRWAREDPMFAQALARARAWSRGERRRPLLAAGLFDEAGAQEFLLRVRRGESVLSMVGTTGQPGRERLNAWKRQRPDFAAAILEAAAFARSLRRPGPLYDEAVADQVIIRLNRGETMRQVWRDPALPGERALKRWRRWRPDFDHAVRMAQLGGHRRRMKARRRCTPAVIKAITDHVRRGGSLLSASRRPGMPCAHSLYGWMKREPAFAEAIRWAKMERNERLLDQGLAITENTTPETVAAAAKAFAAVRLRYGQLNSGRQASPPTRNARGERLGS